MAQKKVVLLTGATGSIHSLKCTVTLLPLRGTLLQITLSLDITLRGRAQPIKSSHSKRLLTLLSGFVGDLCRKNWGDRYTLRLADIRPMEEAVDGSRTPGQGMCQNLARDAQRCQSADINIEHPLIVARGAAAD